MLMNLYKMLMPNIRNGADDNEIVVEHSACDHGANVNETRVDVGAQHY